jgi:hypothetical protein
MATKKKGKRIGFKKLANKVAKSYEKKGMSKKQAEKVGKAVAYKVGVNKYGKAKMKRKAVAGRKKGKR